MTSPGRGPLFVSVLACSISLAALFHGRSSGSGKLSTTRGPTATAAGHDDAQRNMPPALPSAFAVPPVPEAEVEPIEASEPATARASEEPAFSSDEDMRLHVETIFESESADRAWGGDAESTLQTAVGTHLTEGSRLVGVRCRTTVCRVELQHDTANARDDLMRELARTRPWNAPLFSPPPRVEGERTYATIFIAREGYPIAGIAE